MNYYVFSTMKLADQEEDAEWEFVERFNKLGLAEAYVEANLEDGAKAFRYVPAMTEEDAKAQLDMPNRPF